MKRFARTQLVVIAILAFFACGFAAIVLQHFGDDGIKIILPSGDNSIETTLPSGNDSLKTILSYNDNCTRTNVFLLLCFLAFLPIIGSLTLMLLYFVNVFIIKKEDNFCEKLVGDIKKEMPSLIENALDKKMAEFTKTIDSKMEKTIDTNITKAMDSSISKMMDLLKAIDSIKTVGIPGSFSKMNLEK